MTEGVRGGVLPAPFLQPTSRIVQSPVPLLGDCTCKGMNDKQLQDYQVYFRCFVGPGYWGRFKKIKAYDLQHAEQKTQRIADGVFRKRGRVVGEFRVELEKSSGAVAV